MKTEEFLRQVSPSVGIRFVTVIQKKSIGHKVVNTPYWSADDGAELVDRADEFDDFNTYFSLASFAKDEYVDAKGRHRTRTAENATHCRALWRDLDVGEGKPNAYASKDHAITAVIELCGKLSLPIPMVVDSGNGLHAYWPFTRDVPKDEWLRLASIAADVFPRFGLKSDTSRDCDIASVLRPIGTRNRGKLVQLVDLLCEAERPMDPDDLVALLAPHVVTDSLAVVPEFMRGAASAADALAKQREFPPSHADIIAKKCLQMAHFKETGGCNYTTWLMGLGIVKHTVEGEDKAHEWAKNHGDYSASSTQSKLDSLDGGPPTCASFGNANELCDQCEFKGRVRSPIALGYEENPAAQEVAVPTEEDPEATIHIPEHYSVFQGHLCKREVVDGVVRQLRVTKTLFWLTGRHFDPTTGQMVYAAMTRVRQRVDDTWQHRRFDIPAGLVGKGGSELHGALGQNEVFATSDKGAKSRMDALVAAMAEELRHRAEETRAYRVFGWQDDGGFLLGDERLSRDGVRRVKIWGESAKSFMPVFAKNGGDAKTWSMLVEAMYAHADHEAYQTVVLFGIGAPLLKFYQMPTGCLVNMVGSRGTGKTTAARVALSAYGDPNELMTELRSTTELALYSRIATMHSIPVSIDELTNVEPLKASTMCYSIMNGQPRDGLLSSGKRRETLVPWGTVTFAAANGSVIELLALNKGDASAEMSRLIEIDWPKEAATIERHEMDVLLAALNEHMGAMGREFVQWILENEGEAKATLESTRKRIEDELQIGRESRYWSAHIAVPLATKLILQKMGYLDMFSFEDINNFCTATIRRHKTSIVDLTLTPRQGFDHMLGSISNRVISTSTLKDNRANTPDGVIMHGVAAGRVIRDRGVLYLSIKEVQTWCGANRIRYGDMKRDLKADGTLRAETKFYLGKGTTVETGQVYCWELNLDRVRGLDDAATAGPTDASHLKLVKT